MGRGAASPPVQHGHLVGVHTIDSTGKSTYLGPLARLTPGAGTK